MDEDYTIVAEKHGGRWIGWIEEVPGVNAQATTREELLENLQSALDEILEANAASWTEEAERRHQELRTSHVQSVPASEVFARIRDRLSGSTSRPDRRMPPELRITAPTERITTDPSVRSGKPAIRGTRITVLDVLEHLAGGMTYDELLADFPYLAIEDIRAALAFVAAREHSIYETQPLTGSVPEHRSDNH